MSKRGSTDSFDQRQSFCFGNKIRTLDLKGSEPFGQRLFFNFSGPFM
jgi:hypothetical protein